jgi:nicotinamidase-related amidase
MALRNNVAMVSRAARVFSVSTLLTTVAEKSFSGPLFPEVRRALPEDAVIDRSTMNGWEDSAVIDRVNSAGKGRVVIAGLWTSVCVAGPVLSALEQGFEVFVITDACGDVSSEAHERAITRMVQAGARPMTSLHYLLELQRDWARGRTYEAVLDVAKEHGGGYGLGIQYAKAMFGASEGGH